MKAILSDIHGNFEALLAVLADASRQRTTAVYNLGDITCYGPNPIECIEASMGMDIVLRGNFDQFLLSHPDGVSESLSQSILWVANLLESSDEEPSIRERRINFLNGLLPSRVEGDVLYVHGSPRNYLHEYVVPEDIYNQRKMTKIGECFDRICFNGHTHIAGIFIEQAKGKWDYLAPEECNNVFVIGEKRIICNVGSVGQPRDNDWRASYVLFDGKTIRFQRVEYDVETTIRKIYDTPELENFYGDRLREGR